MSQVDVLKNAHCSMIYLEFHLHSSSFFFSSSLSSLYIYIEYTHSVSHIKSDAADALVLCNAVKRFGILSRIERVSGGDGE